MRKTTKFIFILLLLSCCAESVFATAQIPDKLIYNGKEYALHSNPLELYFEKYPDKRPVGPRSTAMWRGYIATFEIVDSVLYLTEIATREYIQNGDNYEVVNKNVISEIFPDQTKVKADWFTGLLVVPHGRMVKYVHMGYASTYSKYLLFEIDAGENKKGAKFRRKQYERFRYQQFLAFKKTEEYKKLVEDLSKEKAYSPEFIDSFLQIFVIQYTSKFLVEF